MYYLELDTWRKLFRNSGLVNYQHILDEEEVNIFYTPNTKNSIAGKYIFYKTSINIESLSILLNCRNVGYLQDNNHFQIDILRPTGQAISIAFDTDNVYIFNGEQWIIITNPEFIHGYTYGSWHTWNFIIEYVNDSDPETSDLFVRVFLDSELKTISNQIRINFHKEFKRTIFAVNNQEELDNPVSFLMLRQLNTTGDIERKTYVDELYINNINKLTYKIFKETPITSNNDTFSIQTGCRDRNYIVDCNDCITCSDIAKEIYIFLLDYCEDDYPCSDMSDHKDNDSCFIDWFCPECPCEVGYSDFYILRKCFDDKTHLCKTIVFHACEHTNNNLEYCKEHSKLCINTAETPYTYLSDEQLDLIAEINEGLKYYKDMFIDYLNELCIDPRSFYWVDITGGFAPLNVRFLNLSDSVDCNGWEFNYPHHDMMSNKIEPTFTYTEPGLYLSSLSCLALERQLMTVPIRVQPALEVDFTYSINLDFAVSESIENFNVNFTSIVTNESCINNYNWNFDLTNKLNSQEIINNEKNPSFIYSLNRDVIPEERFFTVELLVNHSCGNISGNYNSKIVKEINLNFCDFTWELVINKIENYIVKLDGFCTDCCKDSKWYLNGELIGSISSLFYTFVVSGDYSITYTTCGHNITKIITIEPLPPIARFDFSAVEMVAPEELSFIDRSIGEIDTWEWEFNDKHSTTNNISSEQNPNHYFPISGLYEVKLTVTGPGGVDFLYKKIRLGAFAPLVDFEINPITGNANVDFLFSNTTEGEVNKYRWIMSDGYGLEQTEKSDLIRNFDYSGLYDITLRAYGPGGYGIKRKELKVTAAPPICDFDVGFGPLVNDCLPELWLQEGPVIFPAYIKNNSEGEISKYIWDFGDGKRFEQDNLEESYKREIHFMSLVDHNKVDIVKIKEKCDLIITDEYTVELMDPLVYDIRNFCHAYGKSGTYIITLTAISVDGLTSSTCTQTIVVKCRLPVPIFTVETPNGDYALDEFVFINKTTPNCENIEYHWSFEDGFSSNDVNTIHAFSFGGWFDVTLTATNEEGTASYTRTVYARYRAPIADFEFDPSEPYEGVETLTNYQFDDLSRNHVHTWIWDFGDETEPVRVETNPRHIFQHAATYDVTLTVIGFGGEDSITKQIFVQYLPPIADFEFEPNERYAGVETLTTYQFTNLSGDYDRVVDSYLWEFDYNDVQSTLTNPSFKYDNAGTYDVKLTAFGPGGQDSVIKKVYVQYLPPIAAFDVDNLVKFTDEDFIFDNLSSGEITSYRWAFGDGSTSTSFEPNHDYNNPGSYTVTLRVIGPGGEDTTTKQLTVYERLEAIFTINESVGCIGTTFIFTDSSKGDIYTYLWNFGDGSTSNLANPTHIYNNSGNKTITLTLTGFGGTDSLSKQITIEETPVVNFSVNPSSGIEKTTSFDFDSLSSGDIDTYRWEYGDGSISTSKYPPNHIYQTPGVYNASLTVTGLCGTKSMTKQITIRYGAPEASFTPSTLSCCAGVIISFTNSSTGYITGYSWNFGDGSTSNLKNPSHSYSSGGSKKVVLTVSGPGGTDTFYKYLSIDDPVIANFKITPSTGVEGNTSFDFDRLTTGDIDTYYWEYGDGATSSSKYPPNHIFQNAGTYYPKLTVSGECGTDSITKTLVVTNEIPNASFTVVSECCPGVSIIFNDNSTGYITSWLWNFGDGSTSNQQNPSHSYSSGGSKTVTLTVSNPGGSDSTSKTITVLGTVTANFTINPSSGNENTAFDFDSISSGDIDSYYWEFGDGTTYGSRYPANHTYPGPGTYYPKLTVIGQCNNDTMTKTLVVESDNPLGADRYLVFQICNSNAAKDDNFDIYLNSTKIGAVDLSTNTLCGSVFIGNNVGNIINPDFVCPMTLIVSYRFNSSIVNFSGTNSILMKNTQNNNNGNMGTIGVRIYTLEGSNLVNPEVVANLEYTGTSGDDIYLTFSLNY